MATIDIQGTIDDFLDEDLSVLRYDSTESPHERQIMQFQNETKIANSDIQDSLHTGDRIGLRAALAYKNHVKWLTDSVLQQINK